MLLDLIAALEKGNADPSIESKCVDILEVSV